MRGSNFYDDVCIVPYRAEWPRRFRLTKQLIIALLLEERHRVLRAPRRRHGYSRHVLQAHRGCVGAGRA